MVSRSYTSCQLVNESQSHHAALHGGTTACTRSTVLTLETLTTYYVSSSPIGIGHCIYTLDFTEQRTRIKQRDRASETALTRGWNGAE